MYYSVRMGRSTFSPPVPFVGLRTPEHIGDALRNARQRAGLTQTETAEAANMSRESLSHIENGRSARAETLHALLDALGYEFAFLPRVPSGETVGEEEPLDVTITANRMACYVPSLAGYDDDFRLRVILHDFGLGWQHAGATARTVLVAEEPEPFDQRWDAFLAAYAEHLCYHAGLDMPEWAQHERRYLKRMWWAGDPFKFERGSIILRTPAAFEVHGIWIDERELEVV